MIFTVEQATTIHTACVTAITKLSTDAVQSVSINGKSYQKYDIPDILNLMRECAMVKDSGTVQNRAVLLCRPSRARS